MAHTIGFGAYAFGILIAGILLGFVIVLVANAVPKTQPVTYSSSGPSTTVPVLNDTPQPQMLSVGNEESLLIPPKTETDINLRPGDAIDVTSVNFDGSHVRHLGRVLNSDISHLYLTHKGIETNQTAKMGSLINGSEFPVIFVEYSSGGRRWPYATIGPASSYDQAIITDKSKWEVVHPAQENDPLASVLVNGAKSKLIFDGTSLIAI